MIAVYVREEEDVEGQFLGDEFEPVHLPQLVKSFRDFPTYLEDSGVLAQGNADFISLCRPLISEPDLPKLMRLGLKTKSRCISSNNCWAEGLGVGIACKCPLPNKEKQLMFFRYS